ncbi:GspH/FimT family pseudopilin [Candidatus Mycalebacterium sp.]
MKNGGYSLVELIFVLAIAAVVVGLSLPFLVQYAEKSRFESAVQKVETHIRRTKMLAITSHEPYAICVPLGKKTRGNRWRFLTVKGGENCDPAGTAAEVIESAIPYRVFQKSGKIEIRKIIFTPVGTSGNKSFCIESKNRDYWKKITISNFAVIAVTSNSENPCN